MSAPLLDVRDLGVVFGSGAHRRPVVHGLSFAVAPGETLAIVGESGSGKSVTALALMGLLPHGTATATGSARFDGGDLLSLAPEVLRRIRGRRIGMIFQEPMTSLNPVVSIGLQMIEAPLAHGMMRRREAKNAALAMLDHVGIGDPARRFRQFPHELSGGMRQRVMIAMAMLMKPALLIADEPTTALDVTVQAQILDLMKTLAAEMGTSLILITHDMGVVAEVADRVLVMRGGNRVEEGEVRQLFSTPQQPYTRALLDAVPRLDAAGAPPAAPDARPILRLDGISKTFEGRHRTIALDDVSLDVRAGEIVALVGESGSGKSTLGRAAARLSDIDTGAVFVDGADMTGLSGNALRRQRAKVQMIFQDPYASLDPRRTIGQTVAEPILIQGRAGRREAAGHARTLLERVGLEAAMADRYPHEFSGGQRQRIAIARALAAEPRIIVADEPTSALDVSIQAQVLDLLTALREEKGVAFLFISHDLAVVRRVASRVAVMRAGRILELGTTDAVLGSPLHPYTQALLSAVPVPDPRLRGRSRLSAPPGTYPTGALVDVGAGHWVAS